MLPSGIALHTCTQLCVTQHQEQQPSKPQESRLMLHDGW